MKKTKQKQTSYYPRHCPKCGEEIIRLGEHRHNCTCEIEARAEHYSKWWAEQPEYIAKEMTNAEIVKEFDMCIFMDNGTETLAIKNNRSLRPGDKLNYRIINGKLYKKIKNPYETYREVIAW